MEDKELEQGISLGDILQVFLKNIILILTVVVLITALGAFYTFGMVKEKYKSSGTIVLSIVSTGTSAEDIKFDYSAAKQVVQTVAELITEDVVLDAVKRDLGLTMDNVDLAKTISVSYSASSYLINVNCVNPDKELAKEIVNSAMNNLELVSNTEKFKFINNVVTISSTAKTGVYHSPNKIVYLLVSVFIGGVIAVAIVFIKEMFKTKFTNKKDVEAFFNYNVIGLFPDVKELDGIDSGVKLVALDVNSCEPYNKLLSNINYSSVDKKIKVIQFTSSIQSEAKSTTSANLAQTININGKKAILIDLDLRRPTAHKTFNTLNDDGIVDYIANDVPLEKVIKHTDYGVDVISVGSKTHNPLVILESQKLKNLILSLRDKYDYIILDTPPVLVSTDALAVSRLVDGVVFTISANQTKRSQASEAVKSLQLASANVIGISLTKVKMNKNDEYYYYSYSYKE